MGSDAVRLLRRCASWLRPVAGHLAALLAGFAALTLLVLPFALLLLDTLWTRVLSGEPLLAVEAGLLALDPARTVHVPALDPETRRMIARRVVALACAGAVLLLPAAVALGYYRLWILQRVNQLLRVQLLDRLQSLSLRFHAGSRVGDALYRMTQDSAVVTQLVDLAILTPLGAAGRFGVSLVAVASLDPALALLLLAAWPPTLLLGGFFSGRLRARFREARAAQSLLTSRIQETFAGIRVIKAYGAEPFEQQRFERASLAAFDAAYAARDRLALFQVLVFWTLGTAVVLMLARGALSTRDGRVLAAGVAGFTAWNLGVFSFLRMQAQGGGDAIRDLYRAWARLQDVAVGLRRVLEVLDLEPEVRDAPDAVAFEGVRQGIAWRGVHFGYRPEQPVLRGVELLAPAGALTAVVGATGAGKSTLLALLLRLFDPGAGRIEIDGVDLRRFRVSSLRARVSIALQENLLFDDTVRENIRYAVPHAGDEAVREAARVACADEFIRELPQGYDTLLGERGAKLSTGQRQRLSIARAVLKDAPILILDEPTASLDAHTEERLLESLARWGRGRVLLLITHRASSLARADRVALLHDGRIAEQGAPGELMARPGGLYRARVDSERRADARGGAGA